MTGAAVFDRMAATYDDVWTRSAEGRAQREAVWRGIDSLFMPGDRVLDLGCGTGVDAAHLTSRGIEVHAIDPSAEMIRIARERGGFTAEVKDVGELTGIYDGAISNFGALNCASDLSAVAAALSRVVRPGGRVAICTIGRFCLAESVRFAARGQFRKAARRWSGSAEFRGMAVSYPTVSQLDTAFAPGFSLEFWSGIGMIAAPHLPVLRAMADHRLLIFVRK